MLPEGRDPTMHFLSLSLQNSVDLQHLSQVVPQQSTPFAQQPVFLNHCPMRIKIAAQRILHQPDIFFLPADVAKL